MLPCSWKETFGIECPSCGAQRSFVDLISGNLLESFVHFPALLPLISVVILTVSHLISPKPKLLWWIVRLFLLSALLMFGTFLVRFFSH